MASHTHSMDAQSQSSDLAAQILAASTPPQIAAAIAAVESFLHRHPRDQFRWFFSLAFPTLICKTFGFDDPPPLPSHRPPPPSTTGWIDVVCSSNDSDLASRFLNLLSPDGVLMSSMSAVDHLSLIKYVFPIERLPEWVRFALSNVRYCTALPDSCPLFKGNKISTTSQGSSSSCQVELNVFEYYIFWFAYYPVCKRNCENKYSDTPTVSRSDKKSRLENWACSIPGFSMPKRGSDQKVECSGLYVRLLYMYLRSFVPVSDLSNAWQPYRSSLLHYSAGFDSSKLERAEFLVCAVVQFWLVDNDFSPLPMNLCKSFGGCFPFRAVLGETPPTSGLGEVVNVFVKYLNLSSAALTEVSHQAEYTESPRWQSSGNTMSVSPGVPSTSCWNLWVQRPLYRFVLRTFLFCPMETSIKNASQVFSVWISYMEPWAISLEDFKELEAEIGTKAKRVTNVLPQAAACGYSSSWQGYVLSNYLFYSSLVLHFIGFAHKFLHTDPKVVVQMVSKVINILTSSGELLDLIKNVDIAFHSHPTRSSKSMLTSLYRLVPAIREQLQDWEDGLCESSADGSFLHENWNKDLRLFSDGEDGGQQLLQLFILRAESELQSTSGDNLPQCIDSLKTGLGKLFGCHIMKPITNPPEERQHQGSCNEIFKPRRVRNGIPADIKYKGEWMKRPISDDEVGWLANLLVRLSGWLNKNLGLNGGESSYVDPAYVDVPGNASDVYGPTETAKVLLCSAGTWFAALCHAAVGFMKKHGLKVNLRVFASKKVVMFLLVVFAMSAVRRAVAES